jgi:hypothetical protein
MAANTRLFTGSVRLDSLSGIFSVFIFQINIVLAELPFMAPLATPPKAGSWDSLPSPLSQWMFVFYVLFQQ